MTVSSLKRLGMVVALLGIMHCKSEVTLQSLQVTPGTPSVASGTTQAFVATGLYSDNTKADLTSQVTWDSTDTTVALIGTEPGTKGVAKALKPGTTTVSASLQKLSASTVLLVTPATMKAIAITPVDPVMAKGTTVQLSLTATFSDGTTQKLTDGITWQTSSTETGPVDGTGLVTGATPGALTITATTGSLSTTTTVTVTNAALKSIAITPTAASVPKGMSLQLKATGTFSDSSTQDLTSFAAWSAYDGTIAEFTGGNAPGEVTGLTKGSTSITAEALGVTGTLKLTITDAALTSVAITPASVVLPKGTQAPLKATGTYSDGTRLDLTAQAVWTPADETIATVSNDKETAGQLTALMPGAVVLTAAVGDVSGSAVVIVTEPALTAITVTSPMSHVPAGKTVQLVALGSYSDSTTLDLTSLVTWSSSDLTAAPVSNESGSRGLVTTTSPGSYTFQATLNGVTSPAVSVEVDPGG